MRIVLDTNVLVSGLLTPFGICGEIVRMLPSHAITLCVDSRILFEYEDVLRRPRFEIDEKLITVLMATIMTASEKHSTQPLPNALPDGGDHPFLEVAISAQVDYLVTGNLKHFPPELRCDITVLTPREFLDRVIKNSETRDCFDYVCGRRESFLKIPLVSAK